MPSTAGTVMLRAANHLNDPNQLVYSSSVLLPFMNMALDELEQELAVFDLSPLIKESITIDVDIDDTSLDEIPVDFVEALSLIERPRDSEVEWVEVGEVNEIDKNLEIRQVEGIVQWNLRNATIRINPPSTEREVVLNYIRGLVSATDSSTVVDIETSRHFLGLVTARNAALDLGNSPTKAASFTDRILGAKDRLIRRLEKGDQSVRGARRKPYTGRHR